MGLFDFRHRVFIIWTKKINLNFKFHFSTENTETTIYKTLDAYNVPLYYGYVACLLIWIEYSSDNCCMHALTRVRFLGSPRINFTPTPPPSPLHSLVSFHIYSIVCLSLSRAISLSYFWFSFAIHRVAKSICLTFLFSNCIVFVLIFDFHNRRRSFSFTLYCQTLIVRHGLFAKIL